MDRIAPQADRADIRQYVRRAEALRRRALRRMVSRLLRRLAVALARRRAEAALGALDDRALHDLGLDRGGILYAARYGRGECRVHALRRLLAAARQTGIHIWNRRTHDHASASRPVRQGLDRSLEQP